jgi:dihydrofolate synthase / folylpolyglutamate synthase
MWQLLKWDLEAGSIQPISLPPKLSIITNIGLDHTALLGDTMEKIAAEKAGIIKAGIPVIIGTTQPETKKCF